MNCHKLTIRSALVTLCLQRIIIKYYRKKINEKLMGINGNSCYKTHYFLNASLTIIGKIRQFGTKNGRTRINRIERIFFVPLRAEIPEESFL